MHVCVSEAEGNSCKLQEPDPKLKQGQAVQGAPEMSKCCILQL